MQPGPTVTLPGGFEIRDGEAHEVAAMGSVDADEVTAGFHQT
jgi:hypothetical protein